MQHVTSAAVAHATDAVDAVSVGVVIGAVMGWIPAVAAMFTIVWTAIRIYETKTVQGLIARLWRKG